MMDLGQAEGCTPRGDHKIRSQDDLKSAGERRALYGSYQRLCSLSVSDRRPSGAIDECLGLTFAQRLKILPRAEGRSASCQQDDSDLVVCLDLREHGIQLSRETQINRVPATDTIKPNFGDAVAYLQSHKFARFRHRE